MGSVVTVAELMRRCTPAPEVEDDGAAPIPVSALLRREGRSAAGLRHQLHHAPEVALGIADVVIRDEHNLGHMILRDVEHQPARRGGAERVGGKP